MHLEFFIFIGFIPWLAAGKYTSNNKKNTSIFFSSLMHNTEENQKTVEGIRRKLQRGARCKS